MFLAPAGNPSSLRVGHPDVATEHTCLSPTSLSPPPGQVEERVRLIRGHEPQETRLGKTARERGGGILGLGTADSSPREADRYLGAAVVPQEGQGSFPRAHREREYWNATAPRERARLSYTFLKRHQGARALRGRVPL